MIKDMAIHFRPCLAKTFAGLFITMAILFHPSNGNSQVTDTATSHKIKAAYLYNFLKFVTWPESVYAKGHNDITICLYGRNSLGSFFEPLSTKKAQGRSINIRYINQLSESEVCQMIFIGSSEANNISRIIDTLANTSCLTVGETKQFAAHGGMIGFIQDQNRIKLEINAHAAKQAQIQISAKLLEVAKIIYGEEK